MKKLFFISIVLFTISLKSQNKKDTLFIKYDFKLLNREQNPISNEYYYLIKDSNIESGYIYFLEKKIHRSNKFNTKSKIYCLEKIIKNANAFSKKDKTDLIDSKLFDYFSKKSFKTFFLVKNNEFIEVDIIYEIE